MQAIAAAAVKVGSFVLSHFAAVAATATAVAGGVQAYGQFKQAETERTQAFMVADQIDAQAKQERAVAQLQAARQRRIAKSQLSTQRTALSASGFAPDDPTGQALLKETVGAQTLEELLTLAQGEDSARQMERQGQQIRLGGLNTYANGRTQAMSALIQNASSWYDRYWPKPTKELPVPSRAASG
jgi:hypothetical protein